MPKTKVFISHAAVDQPLVNDLRTLIAGTIGLQPGQELFQSSGAGTGVPAGEDFVDYIREQMDSSTFVIAVITASFLQSAFCLAEFGAVWLAAEEKPLFPICVPPVDQEELGAMLPGIHVARLDERKTLVQLLRRISEQFSREYDAEVGDDSITTFQAALPARLEKLAVPKLVPAEKLEAAEATITSLGRQLVEARDEAVQERARADEILAARTREEAEERARALPGDTKEAVEELIKHARDAISRIPWIVAQALPYELRGEPMPLSDLNEEDGGDVAPQVDEGLLRHNEDGTVSLDYSFPIVSKAATAVEELQTFLEGMSKSGREWFTKEYAVPPDLKKGKTFRVLLLR